MRGSAWSPEPPEAAGLDTKETRFTDAKRSTGANGANGANGVHGPDPFTPVSVRKNNVVNKNGHNKNDDHKQGSDEQSESEDDDSSKDSKLDSLKERSKSLLKMIYFFQVCFDNCNILLCFCFQVLPFYLLQFSSGMSLGE